MRIGIPVERNEGLESPVYGHFGSAPMFMVIDTQTREVCEVINRDLHHAHGACSPLKALGGEVVDAVVVGGIGRGALNNLNRAGLKVYQAQGITVAENLACFDLEGLSELTPGETCGGHGDGHGCSR